MLIDIRVDSLNIQFIAKKNLRVTSIGGTEQLVETYLYRVTHDDGWHIEIAYMDFNKKPELGCLEYSSDAPEQIHRLKHGLRMSVSYDRTLQKV